MRISGAAYWLAGACLVAMATSVQAQEQAPGDAQETDDGGLKEIVVTANRRAEDSQKVSLAVTKIDAEDRARRGIATAADSQF